MKRSFFIAGLLSILFSVTGFARDLNQDEALRLRREGIILPFEQLMLLLQQRYPLATLLEAELEEENGMLIYELEILTAEGVVRELELDARKGSILKDKEDN